MKCKDSELVISDWRSTVSRCWSNLITSNKIKRSNDNGMSGGKFDFGILKDL